MPLISGQLAAVREGLDGKIVILSNRRATQVSTILGSKAKND
jgi:hypothetical protein